MKSRRRKSLTLLLFIMCLALFNISYADGMFCFINESNTAIKFNVFAFKHNHSKCTNNSEERKVHAQIVKPGEKFITNIERNCRSFHDNWWFNSGINNAEGQPKQIGFFRWNGWLRLGDVEFTSLSTQQPGYALVERPAYNGTCLYLMNTPSALKSDT